MSLLKPSHKGFRLLRVFAISFLKNSKFLCQSRRLHGRHLPIVDNRYQSLSIRLGQEQLVSGFAILIRVAQVTIAQLPCREPFDRFGISYSPGECLDYERYGSQSLLPVDNEKRRWSGDMISTLLNVYDRAHKVRLDVGVAPCPQNVTP